MIKKMLAAIMAVFVVSALVIGAAVNGEGTFSDVKPNDWFFDDVLFAQNEGLMVGMGENEFSPHGTVTRAMLVTILWRLEGEPLVRGKIYEDADAGAYYRDAVVWASEKGIVSGYSETHFGPDDTATREQFAAIMFRYASYKKYDVSKAAELDKYSDKDKISGYAVESMKWANSYGIITGVGNDMIAPLDLVERCQAAAILRRFCGNFKVLEISENSRGGSSAEPESEDKAEENPNKPSESETLSGGGVRGTGTGASGGTQSSGTVKPEEDNGDSEKAIIKMNTVYANPGDTADVAVDITENPGILGMILSLEYDESAMKLVNVKNGDAVSGVLTLTCSKTLDSGVKFLWDGIEIRPEDIKTGNLMILTFKLSPNAVPGAKYLLTLIHENESTIDADLNGVSVELLQGCIEINK